MHVGVPTGYRHMYIDELIQNEHGLRNEVKGYLGPWEIVSVINGWTDGSGYGGSVKKDGGERNLGWVLLVNEDYPIWTESSLLETASSKQYGGYHYHNWDVLPGDVPTGEFKN